MAARIDPYSLRLFVAAAREGSIARAAAKEHIAASALSRRIADLENALQERMTDEVVRACLEDRADIAVGVARKVPNGMESWHFAADPLMVVLPVEHALAGRQSLRFKDVLAYPLVTAKTGGAVDELLRERAAAARMPIRIAVAVSGFDASCRMVEAGLGIAILPNGAASAYAGSRRFLRLALDETWAKHELRLYAPKRSPRPRALAALISALRP